MPLAQSIARFQAAAAGPPSPHPSRLAPSPLAPSSASARLGPALGHVHVARVVHARGPRRGDGLALAPRRWVHARALSKGTGDVGVRVLSGGVAGVGAVLVLVRVRLLVAHRLAVGRPVPARLRGGVGLCPGRGLIMMMLGGHRQCPASARGAPPPRAAAGLTGGMLFGFCWGWGNASPRPCPALQVSSDSETRSLEARSPRVLLGQRARFSLGRTKEKADFHASALHHA